MGESLRAFCVQNNRQELLRQWDQAKNLAITPDSVSRGSKSKVWWRCQRGHVWQATVASRVAGCGCPVCAGKVRRKTRDRFRINDFDSAKQTTRRRA